MNKLILGVSLGVGAALGCLLATALRIPWLTPLDPNAASVLAALCSTVLAVLGAFGLWAFQVHKKRLALEAALVPPIDPFCQPLPAARHERARERSTTDGGDGGSVRTGGGEAGEVLTPAAVLDYQKNAFVTQAQTLMADAKSLMAPLANVQDLVVSLSPDRLPDLMAVQRIASGVEVHGPWMVHEWTHSPYLEIARSTLSTQSLTLLKWTAGMLAHILNLLDSGTRPDEDYHRLEPGRAAAMKLWGVAQQR